MALKQGLLIALSGVLLSSGGTLLWQQISRLLTSNDSSPPPISASLDTIPAPDFGLTPAFPAESVKKVTFQNGEQGRFELLLVNYQDRNNTPQNALLFPKNTQESVMLPSSTGLRQNIWQTAAETIRQKAPSDAVFLSWWDDAQRLHFLTGRDAWLTRPGAASFNSKFWQTLQTELIQANDSDQARLTKMARWLTMDSTQALKEIRETFGSTKPLYLLVNNDLLMRLPEMADYGGTTLNLIQKTVPISNNLHGDISGIKQLTQEAGDGNYLLQKEATVFRLWLTPKQSSLEKNSLLIHLLPFVDSLKQLPDGVELVYQSQWGGYLSIYRLNPNTDKPIVN